MLPRTYFCQVPLFPEILLHVPLIPKNIIKCSLQFPFQGRSRMLSQVANRSPVHSIWRKDVGLLYEGHLLKETGVNHKIKSFSSPFYTRLSWSCKAPCHRVTRKKKKACKQWWNRITTLPIHVQYCDIMRFTALHNRQHKVSRSSRNAKPLLFC